jgi:hypothetical protein
MGVVGQETFFYVEIGERELDRHEMGKRTPIFTRWITRASFSLERVQLLVYCIVSSSKVH